MRADREAMRLVAQPFDEIKHRIARLEFEWVAPGQEKGLHPRVPIRALSNGNERHINDAEAGQRFLRGSELTAAATDDDKSGRRRIVVPLPAACAAHVPSTAGRSAQCAAHG